jgi:FKBP-type peptidyl-prolyl cis-trans isomerase FkpA
MKKLLLPLLASLFIFIACSDDDKVADQLRKDKKIIEEYLEENNLTAQSTKSGLYYIIDEEGTGDRPNAFSIIKVTYRGTLLDGTLFDEGIADEIPLYSYVEGWQEGIPMFKEGGSGTLLIPSKLGYGVYENVTSYDTIPKSSVLLFDISLDEVELRDVY